jgi:hypothetical protein
LNTGKEYNETLVVDFETLLFVGTILVRVRDAPAPPSVTLQEASYFDGKKRKFQVVVRGKFKRALKMSECFTGQVFDRPAGRLPARWLVHALIRLITALQPQLQVRFGGEPRFLSPLVATAHTAQQDSTQRLQDDLIEPLLDDPASLIFGREEVLQHGNQPSSSSTRRHLRKKIFNSISAQHRDKPVFDVGKEYTFEFYQHMLLLADPEQFRIDLTAHHLGLSETLNGQPLKILAAHGDQDELQPLWSFELWHASLYERALEISLCIPQD